MTARPKYNLHIPSGPLGNAVIALAEQAGLSVGIVDPQLARRRCTGFNGRASAKTALRAILVGTEAEAKFIDNASVQIIPLRRHHSAPRTLPERLPAAFTPVPPDPPMPEIVVTASKLGTALDHYPASVEIFRMSQADQQRFGGRASLALVERMPLLAATDLGPGRNKIFIRGISDSSFTGPTQTTATQYLGDARLTYNAPDPNLPLFDLERVEILEGPQGTLYGTGALGGIIRLVPRVPNLTALGASFDAGLTMTQSGALGNEQAAVVNLPLVESRLAVRALGYRTISGGYIDDTRRALANINKSDTYGGRIAARAVLGGGWTLGGGGAYQSIFSADSQYVTSKGAALSRASSLAQPFANTFLVGHIEIDKEWSGLSLNSTTSAVAQRVANNFDATGLSGTKGLQLFTETNNITLFSHETRIAHKHANRDEWLVGFSAIDTNNRISRRFGAPTTQAKIAGVRNQNEELAIFGQVSPKITTQIFGSFGARLTFTRTTGTLLDTVAASSNFTVREALRFLPSLAVGWQAAPRILTFVHYQQGYRAGGLDVTGRGTNIQVERYRPDKVETLEAGVRLGQGNRAKVAVNASIFYTRWTDIQADLVTNRGAPYTANIGNGSVYGGEGDVTWHPFAALKLEASVFLNDSALLLPTVNSKAARQGELPDIAHAGGRLAVDYTRNFNDVRTDVSTNLRYVGRSYLGVAPNLDIPNGVYPAQGNYLNVATGLHIAHKNIEFSVDCDNLLNVRGNIFSYGNPFGLGQGAQTTPLRPRNIRIGFDANF